LRQKIVHLIPQKIDQKTAEKMADRLLAYVTADHSSSGLIMDLIVFKERDMSEQILPCRDPRLKAGEREVNVRFSYSDEGKLTCSITRFYRDYKAQKIVSYEITVSVNTEGEFDTPWDEEVRTHIFDLSQGKKE
jgi:hypothetical protein